MIKNTPKYAIPKENWEIKFNPLDKNYGLGILPWFLTKNKIRCLEMIKNTPKYAIPKENWEIKFNPSKINTNLWKTKISDLPQTNRWKRRFCFEDHIFEVGFEFGSFNLPQSRVLYQNP